MSATAAHWDRVYTQKDVTKVSWYQPTPHSSLRLVRQFAAPGASVVDVGAGASLLVDHLLDAGHTDLTLVDISAVALDITRQRLGPRAQGVDTQATDLLAWSPGRTFDVWHDRAVFHFLTSADAIAAYRERLHNSLVPGGLAIVAAFHTTGPDRCSSLPTAQYTADRLHAALGGSDAFERLEDTIEAHPHPRGGTQAFQVVALRKRPNLRMQGQPHAHPHAIGQGLATERASGPDTALHHHAEG